MKWISSVEVEARPSEECGQRTIQGRTSGRGRESFQVELYAIAMEEVDSKKGEAKKQVRVNVEVEVFILFDEEVEVYDDIDEKVIEETEMECGVYMMI